MSGRQGQSGTASAHQLAHLHEDNRAGMIKGPAYRQTLLRHLDNLPWLEELGRDYRMKIQSKSPLNDTCQDWALEWLTFGHLQSFLRDGAIMSNGIVGLEKKRMNKKEEKKKNGS